MLTKVQDVSKQITTQLKKIEQSNSCKQASIGFVRTTKNAIASILGATAISYERISHLGVIHTNIMPSQALGQAILSPVTGITLLVSAVDTVFEHAHVKDSWKKEKLLRHGPGAVVCVSSALLCSVSLPEAIMAYGAYKGISQLWKKIHGIATFAQKTTQPSGSWIDNLLSKNK